MLFVGNDAPGWHNIYFCIYMQRLIDIFKSGVIGTSAMTVFSYLYAYIVKDNVKEPKLLAKMFRRLVPGTDKLNARIAGWVIHYAVGLLFAELYIELWERTSVKADVKSGLILGGLSGIAAILIWKFTLESHPIPPSVDFTKHAVNLIIAHLIFGVFAVLAYKPWEKNGNFKGISHEKKTPDTLAFEEYNH